MASVREGCQLVVFRKDCPITTPDPALGFVRGIEPPASALPEIPIDRPPQSLQRGNLRHPAELAAGLGTVDPAWRPSRDTPWRVTRKARLDAKRPLPTTSTQEPRSEREPVRKMRAKRRLSQGVGQSGEELALRELLRRRRGCRPGQRPAERWRGEDNAVGHVVGEDNVERIVARTDQVPPGQAESCG